MKNIWLTLIMALSLVTAAPALMADAQAASAAKSDTKTVQQQSGKVNINSADAALLASVPGIGPKTAEAIIAHREANGKFTSIDDLVSVKGIGEKKLQKMKAFIKI